VRFPASLCPGADRRRGTKGLTLGIIFNLIIGALAGWLAGRIVTGYGFGLLGNILVGIAGAFLAYYLLPRIGMNMGLLVGGVLRATLGAVVLLLLIRLVRRI